MKIKKSVFLILAIFTLFIVNSAGIANASPNADRPTIKVGALGPLAITPGKDMKQGVEMAKDEINSGDGVDVGGVAHNIELIIETSSGDLGIPDPTVGVTAAVKLIDADNVTAIIGGFRTEVVLGIQMQPYLLDRPFLGVGASAPIVSPHFWRIGPSNVSGLARNIIDFYGYALVPDMGVRNITIIREEAAWTDAMGINIKNYFNLMYGYGFQPLVQFTEDIVLPVTYTQDEVTTALAGLKAATYKGLQVNALMTILSGPVGRYVPPAWAANDLSQFLAGINVESQASTYFDETEGACYGEIELETCPPDVEPNEKTAPFRTAYKALYAEEPTYTAFASYDSVYVLKAAIEAADSLTYTDIENALASLEYKGTAYTIKFTSELGPHYTVAINETGGIVYVPILTNETYPEGVPMGAFDVHDLYTNASYGVDGRPYTIGYWAQWQQNGVKKTVWHDSTIDPPDFNDVYTPTDNQRNVTKGSILWPINHDEHGWEPEETTTTSETSETSETEPETSETEPETVEVPGFDLVISLFVLCGLVLIFYRQKQKKR